MNSEIKTDKDENKIITLKENDVTLKMEKLMKPLNISVKLMLFMIMLGKLKVKGGSVVLPVLKKKIQLYPIVSTFLVHLKTQDSLNYNTIFKTQDKN